ncbi:hypothetical protein H8356DRAFT_948509 [Neocallimastix lanati (nom. inval.)]|nr:hypothetical protein H8356DRAFT_948509 [Neocallimastix sp. JGI-2020a]
MKLLKYLIFNVFISFSYCGYQNHQHEEISLLGILLLNHRLENNEISNFRFDISPYNTNVIENTFSSNEKVKSPIYDINGKPISIIPYPVFCSATKSLTLRLKKQLH